MNKHYKYSNILHLITLCCFTLPFFYSSCGPSAEEKMKMEGRRIQDSIDNVNGLTTTNNSDSIIEYANPAIVSENIDSLQANDTIKPSLTESETFNNDKPYSNTICIKYPFLKPILVPKENNYTGLASALNVFELIDLFSCFISLLLLLIAMLIKFIERNARKSIILIELFSFLFLFISQPNIQFTFSANVLWGYWCCLVCMGILVLYDMYLVLVKARHKNTD